MADAPALAGAALVTTWAVAHAMPVNAAVTGFQLSSIDNRRILTMEWLAEAVGLGFIGILTGIVTVAGTGNTVQLVQRTAGAALVALTLRHTLLGARTSIRPMQVCPIVLTIGAALIFAGSAA